LPYPEIVAFTALLSLLAGQPLMAAALAGVVLAVVLALIVSVSRATLATPLVHGAWALREKYWRATFLRQRDPDAPGRARPRAPTAAPAVA
jgi:hypothetical protein